MVLRGYLDGFIQGILTKGRMLEWVDLYDLYLNAKLSVIFGKCKPRKGFGRFFRFFWLEINCLKLNFFWKFSSPDFGFLRLHLSLTDSNTNYEEYLFTVITTAAVILWTNQSGS